MGMHFWVMGLALGLVGFVLGAGCSQQDPPGDRASAVVEREADQHAEAAQTGSAAAAVDAADQSGREPSAAAQEQGAPKASGEGVDDSEISVRRAGQAERDAYEKARAGAKSQFDASGTADQ
ncbi:MAG: hypothetical protein VCE43_20070 [Myxococcota bacterium]